jgi:hypothetical protein
LVSIAPFALKKIAAISTLLPGLDPKVIDKTIWTLERRLAPASAKLIAERRVAHDEASLIKALRLPLLAAAQPYAWQQAQRRWLIFQSALALVVFATAGGLLWFGDSLIAGFAVLAALMLGAALILPMFLEIALSIGQRNAKKPLSIWFWADSRQQLSGLSLALMALLLALAVNVGVGTMVESFSRTFLVWLDGRLAADVYVSGASDAQAAEIKTWLRERPEVEAILPGGRADTQIAGAPIEVNGRPWTPISTAKGSGFVNVEGSGPTSVVTVVAGGATTAELSVLVSALEPVD